MPFKVCVHPLQRTFMGGRLAFKSVPPTKTREGVTKKMRRKMQKLQKTCRAAIKMKNQGDEARSMLADSIQKLHDRLRRRNEFYLEKTRAQHLCPWPFFYEIDYLR